MSAAAQVLERLADELGYREAEGFVPVDAVQRSGARAACLERIRRRLPRIAAVYFATDVPLAYFAEEEVFEPAEAAAVHQQVWNDGRVPLLFLVDSSHIRVYDAWYEPAEGPEEVDSEARLVRRVSATADFVSELAELRRANLDTGAFAAEHPDRFDTSKRCDERLLENLQATRDRLVERENGLREHVAHLLLIRSILLLHLEHRHLLTPEFCGRFLAGAHTLTDVYQERAATYRLFQELGEQFNGDLLPVGEDEHEVTDEHLRLLARFLTGEEDLRTGQRNLWAFYDFSIVPIQLISSIYEDLLHAKDPARARRMGAYYTPFPLVELMMNEVLPWPEPTAPSPSALPRVIDLTCGSGVFLVEAYRRLIAYLRTQKAPDELDAEAVSVLLTEHIYGIDDNDTAVRVAAFSLYLAMLDALTDADIEGGLRFPKLRREWTERPNLVKGNAFVRAPQMEADFDLVVGNPPWGRGKLPRRVAAWFEREGYPVADEMAHGFMWLGCEIAPTGTVALLTPSKWLFNREKPDVEFRRAFLQRNYIESVVNLSAMVSGRHRIFKSSAPAAAIVLRPERPRSLGKGLLYCTPRPGTQGNPPSTLLVDSADVKWLPREEAEQSDDIWKALYVGSWRDLRLVRRLSSDSHSLQDFIDEKKADGWQAGRGFQPGRAKGAPRIAQLPFIDAREVEKYVLPEVDQREPWPSSCFAWTGPLDIYEGPHVLFKKGLVNWRLCATFVPQSCSFRDTFTGVHAPRPDESILKAMTVYLNSSLASYYLFLTVSTWGIDRRTLNKGEVLSLPSKPLRDSASVSKMASLLDRYAETQAARKQKRLVAQMDQIVSDAFDLSDAERTLVTDMLFVGIPYAHRGVRSSSVHPPTEEELCEYAQAFCWVFGELVSTGDCTVGAVVYSGSAPLRVVSFSLGRAADGACGVAVKQDRELTEELAKLDRALWEREGVNLYRRRHVRIFEENVVHVVKPAERRFWTRSAAFHDADEVLAQTLASNISNVD